MKIAICPLVSHDLYRAKRCILSCAFQPEPLDIFFETVVHINTLDVDFAEAISEFCRQQRIRHLASRSDGTPATGKNGVLKFLQDSTFDGCCLIDGDDFVYPSFSGQITRHLKQFPETDLLSTCAMDEIRLESSFSSSDEAAKYVKVGNGVRASLWGSNDWKTAAQYRSDSSGILLKDAPCWPIAIGAQMFYSKKLAKSKRFDSRIVIGEDVMLEHEVLADHQSGKMVFFKTFCSDMYVYDRTLDNNIQIKHADLKRACFDRIRARISFLDHERCSMDELPMTAPPIISSWNDKVEYIRGLLA